MKKNDYIFSKKIYLYVFFVKLMFRLPTYYEFERNTFFFFIVTLYSSYKNSNKTVAKFLVNSKDTKKYNPNIIKVQQFLMLGSKGGWGATATFRSVRTPVVV